MLTSGKEEAGCHSMGDEAVQMNKIINSYF